jgi:hypothetical protein
MYILAQSVLVSVIKLNHGLGRNMGFQMPGKNRNAS